MGLDIRVYTRLKFERSRRAEDDYPPEWDRAAWVLVENPKGFQRQVADLQPPGFWSGERGIGFQAGSYGGYNEWRDTLSQLVLGVPAKHVWANTAEFEDKPFFDLIHFSDCEGFIGPAACARLATAFQVHLNKFHSAGSWRRKADEWAEACEIAAGNFGGLQFT